MEISRFLVVAVAGLILDLAVAWSAASFLKFPLWLAAAIGFSVAAMANYVLLELWTFRSQTRRLSVKRALRYCVALFAALATRVCTVAALTAIIGEPQAILVLVAGAGISFCIHYIFSKYFVFINPKGPAQ